MLLKVQCEAVCVCVCNALKNCAVGFNCGIYSICDYGMCACLGICSRYAVWMGMPDKKLRLTALEILSIYVSDKLALVREAIIKDHVSDCFPRRVHVDGACE